MKRLVALAAALLILLSTSLCAYALYENYALDIMQWTELDGTRTELLNENGVNGFVKYYVDEDDRTVYVYINYFCTDYKAEDNRVFIFVSAQNGARTTSFTFDENGFFGEENSDFKLVQSFGEATEYGQEITFAFQFKNKSDFTTNQLKIYVTVNGANHGILDKSISLTPSKTTKATTQKTTKPKTTKQKTTKESKKTTKSSNNKKTTKFTPPADADYINDVTTAPESTTAREMESESFVDVPIPEEHKTFPNHTKVILACAAGLALVGSGLVVKGIISAKNKKKAGGSPEVKNPKIDEQSKEIIDRYIDDDYDIEE